MRDMTDIANVLGGFLPGAYPQFMVGLKLHSSYLYSITIFFSSSTFIGTGRDQSYHGTPSFFREWYHTCLVLTTFCSKGTTRIGKDPKTSVANAESRVHDIDNLWVGGNGCIPDATASNPTRTSVRSYDSLPNSIAFSSLFHWPLSYFRWPLQSKVPTPCLHISICQVVHTIFPTSLTTSLLVILKQLLRSCLSLPPNVKLRVQVSALRPILTTPICSGTSSTSKMDFTLSLSTNLPLLLKAILSGVS